ncbi:MAG: putative porin [Bacteroidales bacterium]|nr:putative porin [Bacteroidales bacterium]
MLKQQASQYPRMAKRRNVFSIYYLRASLLLLSIILFSPSHSQECDTIIESKDTSNVYFYYHNVDSLALGRLHEYNMTLSGIQNYDQIYKETPFFASLGNPGLLYKNLLFNPNISSGFNFGIHSFDAYIFNNKNTEYYKLNEPFTELIYLLGPKKEQMIGVKFDTKIFPQLTLGADFRYIYAPGRYQRQKSDNKSLALTAQFFTKSKRYGIIGNYHFNKIFVYENGGITEDSLFEKNIDTDRFVMPVNLSSAENQIKQSSFFFNQFFNIQKKHKKINDSTYVRRNIHAGRITHLFAWTRQTQKYIDGNPTAGFYQNIYLDSTNTFDSIYHFNISNKFMWSNLGYLDSIEKKPFYLYGAIRHEYHEVGGYSERKYFNQIIPSAGIYWLINKTFLIRASAEFVSGNYNGGDYKGEARCAYIPGKIEKKYGRIEFAYELSKQKPGWFYQYYSANNFQWDNDFKSTDIGLLSLYYTRPKLKAGIEYIQLKNYVSLDSLALPQQSDSEISVLKVSIFKDFRIKIVGIDTRLAYQKASDNTYIALPEIMAEVAIFVTIPIFKKAAIIQPGIQLYYNTMYYASAYMPALRSFYDQSQKEIGNFVYADFFFNLRIKRARMFFKYSHFNSHFGTYNYYMVPSYPMMDAGFRFGISWKFFE